MKRISALFLFLSILLLLPSCGERTVYRNDLSCEALALALEAEIPVDHGYLSVGPDHWRYYFDGTAPGDDRCIRISAVSEDINEIGIFRTTDRPSQKELLRSLQDYLDRLREEKSAFIGSYAPQELPKLKEAQIRCFGDYTVYAILSREAQERLFGAMERILSRNEEGGLSQTFV